MAIDAKFTADCSDFNREVEGAARQLELFEKEAGEAGAAAVELGGQTKAAGSDVKSIAEAYRQFDGALAAAGINIGPLIRLLTDLAGAMGKTWAAIGLLGTAGLVLGTFITAFKITRTAIGTFFPDLDRSIGENVSAWMGWGDVAEQEAGAVQDALNLATKNAGRQITDYNEAIRINAEFIKNRSKEVKEDIKAQQEWEKATAAVVIAAQDHNAILAQLNPKVVEAAQFALQHGVSQKDVATAYQLTASEMAAVNFKIDEQKIKLKELEAQQKLADEAMEARGKRLGTVIDDIFGVEALQKATTWVEAMGTVGVSMDKLSNEQLVQLKDAMIGGIAALAEMGGLTTEQADHFANLAAQADAAINALKPMIPVVHDLSKEMWEYVRALDAEAEAQRKAEGAAAAKAAGDAKRTAEKAAGKGDWTAAFGGAQFPQGVITDKGGVARDMFGRVVPISPNLNIPRITPGLNPGANVQVNVHGMIVSTYQQLADAIGDAMVRGQRAGGNRLPV